MVVVAVVVVVVAFTMFLVYCLSSIFIARHFSNQIASHTIIQTSASRQSGIKLVRHNELDQKEMLFSNSTMGTRSLPISTDAWILMHERMRQQSNDKVLRYAENDEWSEYEKVEHSPIAFET
jgi:predicted GH43/DUF377 family glycosyl hydrolase